jgi:hypothetical protein
MKSKLISGIRKMPEGGIQSTLGHIARETPEEYGASTVLGIKNIGDLTAGITFALDTVNCIGSVEKAMPGFDYRSTGLARKGKEFGVDLETLEPYSRPVRLDPGKTKIINN